MTWYPRRAVYGNGYDRWEIDILTGNALERGANAVENERVFTYKDGISYANKVRTNKGKKPIDDMTREEGYEYARILALKEFKRLQESDPVVASS